MPIREFADERGRSWIVWEVAAEMPKPSSRLPVSKHLETGWLVFETATERRRLAPPPAGWADESDDGLLGLLRHAAPVRPPRRLIE